MSRILFLYATNNSGHQKAAEAIKKSLLAADPHIKTFEVDFFTYHYPTLGPFIFRMYVDIMRSIPHTWDYLYDNTGVAEVTSELRQFFNQLNIPKLQKVLRDYRPHAVVCTQAVPAGFMATEKERGLVNVPLFVTVTDFVANPYWPVSQVDGYFVPDREIKEHLLKRNIPDERIKVTGIPIDNRFARTVPKALMRQKLGLQPDITTVIIMGGSQGLGEISYAVKELITLRNLQLIVVTGSNRFLCRSLKKRYATSQNLLILGHVNNVARLMDAADLLISKPGGLTSAEAMAKGLPIIIISPLPGQEERNAVFLCRNGIAERCDEISTLRKTVESFLSHPLKLKKLQMQSFSLGRPYASRDIANHILSYLRDK